MNIERSEHEARLQALAEQAEREGLAASGDPQLDRYRLVARALRQPLMHALPEDFAAHVLRRIGHAEERSGLEDGLTTALLLVMAVVGLLVMQPFLGVIIDQFQVSIPDLPWPQLVGSVFCIGVVWQIDRFLTSSRQPAT